MGCTGLLFRVSHYVFSILHTKPVLPVSAAFDCWISRGAGEFVPQRLGLKIAGAVLAERDDAQLGGHRQD